MLLMGWARGGEAVSDLDGDTLEAVRPKLHLVITNYGCVRPLDLVICRWSIG
jgi:hypothetical protein